MIYSGVIHGNGYAPFGLYQINETERRSDYLYIRSRQSSHAATLFFFFFLMRTLFRYGKEIKKSAVYGNEPKAPSDLALYFSERPLYIYWKGTLFFSVNMRNFLIDTDANEI